jgi:hypothetical protein
MLSTRCDSAMSIASAPRRCGRAVSARPTAAPSEVRSPWFGLPLCVVPSASPPPEPDITRLAQAARRRARRRGDLSLLETRGSGSAAENSLHAQRRLIGRLIQTLTPFERCLRPAKASFTSGSKGCLRPQLSRTDFLGTPSAVSPNGSFRPATATQSCDFIAQIATSALGAPRTTQADAEGDTAPSNTRWQTSGVTPGAPVPTRQQRRWRTDCRRL